MTRVHVYGAARTPHGRFLGSLADHDAVDLGATAVTGLLERVGLDGDGGDDAVDYLALGNAIQAGVGQVPARQVGVRAGLTGVPATTVNEASGSGLRALALAVDRLRAGQADLAVAGGTESMSSAPYLVEGMRRGHRYGDATLVDAMIHDALYDVGYDAHMGELTERLVDRFDLSRRDQDAYAAESHRRAAAAVESGAFDDEIVPVTAAGEVVLERDEGPRPDTDVETLAGLEPAFVDGGTITAGNASDLADGAGAVLLGTGDALDREPLATVTDYAVAYGDPQWFGMRVGDAVERLLERNGLGAADVDSFELNEAFAAQMVYVRDRLGIPLDRLNPQGGAVALGHPIGASGGLLATTLAHRMAEADHARGVVGMSVGGGGAIAALFERE